MLNTSEAKSVYNDVRSLIIKALQKVDRKQFDEINQDLSEACTILAASQSDFYANELYLNDLYVINALVDFLKSYVRLWQNILGGHFSESWSDLQDCLDLLRVIKKFSDVSVEHFEIQLLALERLYPYGVFFSIGATVEYFECSICEEDIDSLSCPHVKGELYSGLMAVGVAKNISHFDHVAIVSQPEDKRCTVRYENDSEHFHVVRYLSRLLNDDAFPISHFKELDFSKVRKKNPDFQKQGRNEECACGSGKKFKKCCIDKEYIESEHVEIVPKPFDPTFAIS
ncbi:SEC-C metal-binding domain-containing protein [Modicisalibacter xianhensis]|uniref:SEC-C metal-binding domain-containing protein n=1 Tax=Modicisalibacter xianhensis TaxID=442341 RepID=UPI001416F46C|nr:SEC-C metal-binding domain-containing protein [Halomonas xianhensis]